MGGEGEPEEPEVESLEPLEVVVREGGPVGTCWTDGNDANACELFRMKSGEREFIIIQSMVSSYPDFRLSWDTDAVGANPRFCVPSKPLECISCP